MIVIPLQNLFRLSGTTPMYGTSSKQSPSAVVTLGCNWDRSWKEPIHAKIDLMTYAGSTALDKSAKSCILLMIYRACYKVTPSFAVTYVFIVSLADRLASDQTVRLI
ncbi:hypothetical protein DPMN_127097 [Dreissena polymorpha]|uniref:Uncharacterized protein n=1 Tax=Dreissena polymorpha TaxID=45954 RepID=A0A9D4H0M7_DREPO|nr:hypothetical protein DPMN_127097 [Dreissena polymorpha]